MNNLYYYCNLLYIDDVIKTELDDETYKDWIEDNCLSYEKVQKNYEVSNNLLNALLISGIPAGLIGGHIEYFAIPLFLGTILKLMNKAIKEHKENKFVNKYFDNKNVILNKVKHNEQFEQTIKLNNKDYQNNISYAITQFEHLVKRYNKDYDNIIFLQPEDLDILYPYLKSLVDQKVINKDYCNLFTELLNRASAKGLYNEENIFLENLICEIPNIDENNTKLMQNVMNFYNSINTNTTGNIIDISERKKR